MVKAREPGLFVLCFLSVACCRSPGRMGVFGALLLYVLIVIEVSVLMFCKNLRLDNQQKVPPYVHRVGVNVVRQSQGQARLSQGPAQATPRQ